MLEFLIRNKLIFAIFLISFLFTYSYIDFEANMSVGEGHVYLAKSIALSRDFNLNEYWGNAGVDVIKLEGNYYSSYPPLNGLLMAIPYFILQVIYYLWVRFFGSIDGNLSIVLESLAFSLPSSIALAGILIILKKYLKAHTSNSPYILNLFIIGTGLGTLLFSYSVSFFNHVISTFFILSGFYLLTSNHSKKYLWAGILTGLAFLTEYPTILFSIAVFVSEISLLLSKKKKLNQFIADLLWYAVPISISILILFTYNLYHFGDPFLFAETILREQKTAIGAATHSFSQNPVYGLYGEFFSPLKGLFIYSPFLIFSILGIKTFFRNHPMRACLALSYIALISLIYSLWNDCFGATVYGSRYLISIIPFLAIFSAYFLQGQDKNRPIRYLFAGLVAVGVLLTASNAWVGIADGKMNNCRENLNSYNPYLRAHGNFNKSNIKTSPVIFKYLIEKQK